MKRQNAMNNSSSSTSSSLQTSNENGNKNQQPLAFENLAATFPPNEINDNTNDTIRF
jgi:hypothetical protein